MTDDRRPVVAIYKDKLLPPSQTFVRLQAETLRNYLPLYVTGGILRDGLSLPRERCLVVNTGGWLGAAREAVFQISGFAPKMFRRLRAVRPVLIHSHFGPDGLRGRYLSRKLGVPLVVTFHGYDATILPGASPSRRFRSYLRHRHVLGTDATLLIAVSQHIKQRLVEQGLPAEKMIVHYIGIDPDCFRANPAVAREPIVLFVARLVEKKGCEYLIQAMSRVQAENPNAKLVIIGEGHLRGKLQELASRCCKNVDFLGVKPMEEIRHWMNRATVFSVPSVTAANGDQEGFGLVFAEAQAMGLPVASFASAGVKEAVADGITGFLTGERDVEGLAKNILVLLNNSAIWRQLSEAGMARVRSLFNVHTQTRILEDIYSLATREASSQARQPARFQVPEMPTL
jgi:colanic acid/amylovoran biosynthesis glycosyltransferase